MFHFHWLHAAAVLIFLVGCGFLVLLIFLGITGLIASTRHKAAPAPPRTAPDGLDPDKLAAAVAAKLLADAPGGAPLPNHPAIVEVAKVVQQKKDAQWALGQISTLAGTIQSTAAGATGTPAA